MPYLLDWFTICALCSLDYALYLRHKNHALGLVWRNVQIVDGFEVVVAQWAFSMRMLDRVSCCFIVLSLNFLFELNISCS